MSLSYTVAPLHDGAFGIAISDLSLAKLSDPEVRRSLYDLWIENGLIVFRDFDGEAEGQIALSEVFGAPEVHPLSFARSGEASKLVDAIFRPGEGTLYSVAGEARGAWQPWHSDLIYTATINHGGILRPIALPPSGGNTAFLDKAIAYRTLPDDLKRRIEGLDVVYRYDADASRLRFPRDHGIELMRLSASVAKGRAQAEALPCVLHPMVYVQPGTGRKLLNVSPRFALAVHGVPAEEGDELLERVIDHIMTEPGVYEHVWHPNEMVLWDNWRVLHTARGVPEGQFRHMQRTTIAGDYAMGRLLPSAA